MQQDPSQALNLYGMHGSRLLFVRGLHQERVEEHVSVEMVFIESDESLDC
jgi:hypothetical protein